MSNTRAQIGRLRRRIGVGAMVVGGLSVVATGPVLAAITRRTDDFAHWTSTTGRVIERPARPTPWRRWFGRHYTVGYVVDGHEFRTRGTGPIPIYVGAVGDEVYVGYRRDEPAYADLVAPSVRSLVVTVLALVGAYGGLLTWQAGALIARWGTCAGRRASRVA